MHDRLGVLCSLYLAYLVYVDRYLCASPAVNTSRGTDYFSRIKLKLSLED